MSSYTAVKRTAAASYPSASSAYTASAVRKALAGCLPEFHILPSPTDLADHSQGTTAVPALQISDYDEIQWEGVKELEDEVLVNAYPIRKALIRKNALHQTVLQHVTKHTSPSCSLRTSIPQTFSFELAFADELDELFSDDLYELGVALDEAGAETEEDREYNGKEQRRRWWILKPAMADRGQGIRIFRSRDELEAIFERFEISDDEDNEEGGNGEQRRESEPDTAVSTSQLRHWIIQKYISCPLLLDPHPPADLARAVARKHHLRVYVLAVGALDVYVFTDILALFAATRYSLSSFTHATGDTSGEGGKDISSVFNQLDLSAHLTNTCLQSHPSEPASNPERNVHLFSDIVSLPILPPSTYAQASPSCPTPPANPSKFTSVDYDNILDSICATTGELFRAAATEQGGAHFQLLPNAFEIFGLDFLVDEEMRPWLLEVNACPDFAQTGDRLSSVVDRLFEGALRIAVVPFFSSKATVQEAWQVGSTQRFGFRKCLSLEVRGPRR